MHISTNTRKIFITAAVALGAFAPAVASAAPIGSGGTLNSGCPGKTIYARANNQTIVGTDCNDLIFVSGYVGVTVYAGGGDDDVRGGYNTGTTTVYLGAGNDQLTAKGTITLVAYGEDGNDTMSGSSVGSTLMGGNGDDILESQGGSSYLNGGAGNDTMSARNGKIDAIVGETGHDSAWVDHGVDHIVGVEQFN